MLSRIINRKSQFKRYKKQRKSKKGGALDIHEYTYFLTDDGSIVKSKNLHRYSRYVQNLISDVNSINSSNQTISLPLDIETFQMIEELLVDANYSRMTFIPDAKLKEKKLRDLFKIIKAANFLDIDSGYKHPIFYYHQGSLLVECCRIIGLKRGILKALDKLDSDDGGGAAAVYNNYGNNGDMTIDELIRELNDYEPNIIDLIKEFRLKKRRRYDSVGTYLNPLLPSNYPHGDIDKWQSNKKMFNPNYESFNTAYLNHENTIKEELNLTPEEYCKYKPPWWHYSVHHRENRLVDTRSKSQCRKQPNCRWRKNPKIHGYVQGYLEGGECIPN